MTFGDENGLDTVRYIHSFYLVAFVFLLLLVNITSLFFPQQEICMKTSTSEDANTAVQYVNGSVVQLQKV